MVYAYSLQELMRYGEDDLLRRQAEGITVSAMHQQWPFGENDALTGTYPDSFGRWFTVRNPLHINPEDIVVNTLAMKGLDPGIRSQRVTIGEETAHLASVADITAEAEADGLRATLRYVPNQTFYATLAPVQVGDATAVTANGQPLVRRESLPAGETGWTHERTLGVLCVGATANGDGEVELAVRGVQALRLEPPAPRAEWDFDDGVQGFVPEHDCLVRTGDGTLVIEPTGEDPYAVSGPCAIDADATKHLRIRARTSRGGEVELFWRSTVSPGWGTDKEVRNRLPADGEWHEIVFDLTDHALWAGRVLQIRLDPEAGAPLEIDRARPE
jgi:hypothetical protein